jgi:hypothetical protein
MKKYISITLAIFYFILIPKLTLAGWLSGIVLDSGNKPISFASVYVVGTTIGTSANADGIYKLTLAPGTYRVAYRMMGFEILDTLISVGQNDVSLDVVLQNEALQLNPLNINVNAEDPAYAIIRKAQQARAAHLAFYENYTCSAYVKSTQRITDYPKKIMGEKVDLSTMLDTTTGIIYLSESVSVLYVGENDAYKERVVSSVLSGSPKGYTFNNAASTRFNFYEPNVQLGNLTPRGLVSPIAPNALLYYQYKLLGVHYENGLAINTISVVPKRITDPVFAGVIEIRDDNYSIYAINLSFSKPQVTALIDTFIIKQIMVPVTEALLMPFSTTLDYKFSFLGFKGRGTVLGMMSNYEMNQNYTSDFFKGPVLEVTKSSNEKDSLYWQQQRPIPLVPDEVKDYSVKDSIRIVTTSKAYVDSVNQRNNRVSLISFLNSYTYTNADANGIGSYFTIKSPINRIAYNTVQGWNADVDFNLLKRSIGDHFSSNQWHAQIGYGLGNKKLFFNTDFTRNYHRDKSNYFKVYLGARPLQINERGPINNTVNTIYTLFDERNFMKLYHKDFIGAANQIGLFRGCIHTLEVMAVKSSPMVNTTDQKWFDRPSRQFTSNNPLVPSIDSLAFNKFNFLQINNKIKYVFGQRFMIRPDEIIRFESKYPTLTLEHTFYYSNNSNANNLQLLNINIKQMFNFRLLGAAAVNLNAGFFSRNDGPFLLNKHFNGNQTIISNGLSNEFMLLPYYTLSASDRYLHGHIQHDFRGFLFNKIPFIRKLKLNELVGARFLKSDSNNMYAEFSFGVERLQFIQLHAVMSVQNANIKWGWMIGLKKSIVL